MSDHGRTDQGRMLVGDLDDGASDDIGDGLAQRGRPCRATAHDELVGARGDRREQLAHGMGESLDDRGGDGR